MNLKERVLYGIFLIFFNLAAWQKDGVPIAIGPGDQTERVHQSLNYQTPRQVLERSHKIALANAEKNA